MTIAYGNGDSVKYTYDRQGKVTEHTYEDGDKVDYRYDNSGGLAQVEDSATGIQTKYAYDLSDRLMMYEENAGGKEHRVRYYYDTQNNLTKVREGFDGVNRTTTYTYDKDNRVTGVAQSDTSETYTYDDNSERFGRLEKTELKHNTWLTVTDTYSYINPGHTSVLTTSMQVEMLTTTVNGVASARTYAYDENGNIISVSDGTNTTTYVYDSANQLLRENNQAAGKTWGWTYDEGGNIRSKTEYTYTTGELGTPLDTVQYGYSTGGWGDLLTSHDGNTITSDAIGNMLTYGNSRTFTWEHGRELSGMTDASGTWSFAYNVDGLRVYRSNGTATYKYYYSGDKLTRMVVNGEDITFGYDANGAPQYVIYGGHRYFYLTNLQGDVTAIITVGGTTVVEYTYDAWGNILTVTGGMANTLGKANPLRYRGYIYDEETRLYYLQSRYYDPEIGRFINADIYTSTGQGLLGNNMFAYCGNNPVMREDSGGAFWHIVGGAVLGAVAGTVTKMIINVVSDQKITDGLFTAGIAGAVSGGLAASGVCLVGQVIGNALIGAGNNAADQLIGMSNGTKTDGFDVGSMLLDSAIGAAAGFAGGAGAGNRGLTNIGLKNIKRTWNAFTHKGASVALDVFGQGLSYFGKNAQHMVKPLAKAIVKSSGSVIINNTAKAMIA